MSDPLGRHFCEFGEPEEDGSNFCRHLGCKTGCMGYSEDCEAEPQFCFEDEMKGLDDFEKDQANTDAQGLL